MTSAEVAFGFMALVNIVSLIAAGSMIGKEIAYTNGVTGAEVGLQATLAIAVFALWHQSDVTGGTLIAVALWASQLHDGVSVLYKQGTDEILTSRRAMWILFQAVASFIAAAVLAFG